MTGRRKKYKVVADKTYPEMFRVKYPDGELSADMYNLPRAKNHAAVLEENDRRSTYRIVSIDTTEAY